MAIKDQALASLEPLQQEWNANQRLRLGLVAICGILMLYLLLVLVDAVADSSREHEELLERYQRLATLYSQDEWIDRADQAAVMLRTMEGRFPVAATSGRAEADVRELLNGAVQRAGASRLSLLFNPGEPVPNSDLWKVSATINGIANGDQLRALLNDIEAAPGHVRLKGLRLVRGKNAVRIRANLDVEVFFRRGDRQ